MAPISDELASAIARHAPVMIGVREFGLETADL
jgi:hypothetical protein